MRNNFNKFTLGTVQFGKPYGPKNLQTKKIDEIVDIFNFFYTFGGRHIDCARNYGNAEKLVGNIHENRFNLSTKVDYSGEIDDLYFSIEDSFENLKISKLDKLFFHNNNILNQYKNIPELCYLIKSKFPINKIGFSIYDTNDLAPKIFSFKDLEGFVDIIQCPANVYDMRFIDLQNKFDSLDIIFEFRSIFLQGNLLDEAQSKLNIFSSYYEEWFNFCKKNKCSPLSLAMNTIFHKVMHAKSLITFGCRSLEEIKQIEVSIGEDVIEYPYTQNVPQGLIDPRTWTIIQ